jgi:dTDP-4-amino-4,6-dideoxygalactose transaminase
MALDTEIARQTIAAAKPALSDADVAAALVAFERILRSGRLILGDYTRQFEAQFRAYIGAPEAVAVSSCSDALRIALRFHDVRGREVLLPVNNFPGVVSIVLDEGGIPVFADMNPATFCADTEDLLRRISSRTAGIVIVHIAGLVYPDIGRLRDMCEAQGLFLIEDAAHALGASFNGRRAGSLAETACFSFYPTKTVTTATGGMIVTRNAALGEYARSLRHYGQGGSGVFAHQGGDWAMSELHAALGCIQLQHLDEFVEHRNAAAGWYREALNGATWVSVPQPVFGSRHAYFKFPVLLDEAIEARKFRDAMREQQVENGTLYDPPCHLQPAFRGLLDIPEGAYPAAEATLKRQFCPPIHSTIARDEVERVVRLMNAVVESCRRA